MRPCRGAYRGMKREKKELATMDVECAPDLTDEEKNFLEEHVYGEWEFHDRLPCPIRATCTWASFIRTE